MQYLILLFLGLSSILFSESQQPPTDPVGKARPASEKEASLLQTPMTLQEAIKSSDTNLLVEAETHDLLSPSGKSFKISLLTPKQAEDIFKEMAEQKNIPFCYPEDGCYARAHEMTRLMEKKGIISGKIFLEGDLKVETKNTPKGYVEWWFHVVPLVAVKKGDKIVLSVIDPSIASSPLTIEEWVAKQTSHPKGKAEALYRTERFNYLPSDKMQKLDNYRVKDIEHTTQTLNSYLVLQKERNKPNPRSFSQCNSVFNKLIRWVLNEPNSST